VTKDQEEHHQMDG